MNESQVTKLIGEQYNARMNAIFALAKNLEEQQAKLEIFLQTAIAQPIAKCDNKWDGAKVYVIEKWEHDRFLVVDENQNREVFSREELVFTEKELLQVDNYLTLAILSQNSHL